MSVNTQERLVHPYLDKDVEKYKVLRCVRSRKVTVLLRVDMCTCWW